MVSVSLGCSGARCSGSGVRVPLPFISGTQIFSGDVLLHQLPEGVNLRFPPASRRQPLCFDDCFILDFAH